MKNKLPEGWEDVTLSEVCEVKKGTSITKDKVTEGNIPVIAGGQQPAYYHNVPNRTGETITVSGSGAYAGFVAYFNIPIFASDCSTIQAKTKDVSIRYIYYLLKGQQKLIYDLQKGIAQPHVYPKDLAKIKIHLPPLSTQQKIVSILEKAEKAKEWRKKADDLTKDFLKSVFWDMFKDNDKLETQKLGDVCDVQSGGTPSRTKEEYWNNGNIPWLGSTVCKDKYVNESEQFITEEGLKNSSARFFKKGTILVALVGATIGKTAYLNFEATTNQNIAGIYPKEGIDLNSEYLFYAMQTLYYRFMSLSSDTFKMANLTFVRNLEIPLPPIELQNKFASIVKEVKSMKEQQKHSKEQIDKLFNALMQKAFKGELI